MVAAAPGITDEQKAAITADIEKMANSDGWKKALADQAAGTTPILAGDAFEAQLAADIEATSGDPERHRPRAMSRRRAGRRATRRPDRAALVIARAASAVAGGRHLLRDARDAGRRGSYARVGPTTLPYAIAGVPRAARGLARRRRLARRLPRAREPSGSAPMLWIVGGLAAADAAAEARRLLDRHRAALRLHRARASAAGRSG